jgi:tRNA dimethylallyltransferase
MIFGPTGVGKSKLGIEIAKKYNGEIISMDSMQVYNELDILTNKVTTEEAEGIPHHLLSIQSVEDQFTVRDFLREADKLIADIRERGKLPLLVGGTTYYAFSFFLRSGDGSVSKNEEILEQIESLTSLDEAERQSELGNLLKNYLQLSFPPCFIPFCFLSFPSFYHFFSQAINLCPIFP